MPWPSRPNPGARKTRFGPTPGVCGKRRRPDAAVCMSVEPGIAPAASAEPRSVAPEEVQGFPSMPRVEGGITTHQNGLEVPNDQIKLNRLLMSWRGHTFRPVQHLTCFEGGGAT